ncbi:MAG: glycosyltransferase family 2 protein [Alloprevotella sp.]|nr:glycosyltransferase family 2 protein [Alloprevotella sp.]
MTPLPPRTAIVILNWNGEKMLRRFLPSVVKQCPHDAIVVVADNGSTDHSLEVLRQDFPSVYVEKLKENFGFAEGYNRALSREEIGRITEYDYLDYFVLLNSDVEVSADWLQPLTRFMDEHPDAAACQPKLRAEGQRDYFEYAGAAGGYLDRYGYPYCRGRVFSTVERDEGQYDTPAPVLWATGAALLIRRKDWEESGGLDGRFFAHMEEIDLCWRLRARGHDIFCIPQSVVYHVGGGTLNAGSPHKTFLNFRNNLFMLYKNLPERDLRPVMRMRCFLDYVAAAKMLLTDGPSHAAAVLRARREYKARRHEFRPQREENLRLSTGKPIAEILPASLLWLYYARGRKTFARLRGVEG